MDYSVRGEMGQGPTITSWMCEHLCLVDMCVPVSRCDLMGWYEAASPIWSPEDLMGWYEVASPILSPEDLMGRDRRVDLGTIPRSTDIGLLSEYKSRHYYRNFSADSWDV